MSQKELIHVSFGPFASHLSAHLFNAQSAQFDYGPQRDDDDDDDAYAVPLDHDVDWRAGLGQRGEDTYCPRLVLFDTRQGCRGRRFMDGPYEEADEEADDDGELADDRRLERHGLNAWSQPAIIERTEPRYEEQSLAWMDAADRSRSPSPAPSDDEEPAEEPSPLRSSQRKPRPSYRPHRRTEPPSWSSYSLFDLHPRSLHPLRSTTVAGELRPMLDDDEPDNVEEPRNFSRLESWEMGMAVANDEEKSRDVMDESIRWFAEDSDALQGFNFSTSATDGFAGFSSYYLSQVRDEYPKSTVMLWSALWGTTRPELLEGQAHERARVRAMNAVLSLATFSDNASLTVPLVVPATSPPHLSSKADLHSNVFHATAFLAPHIDTSTLSMRLKASRTSATSLVSQLNWRRDTPLASLRGVAPTPSLSGEDVSAPMDPIDALLASRGYGPSCGRSRPLDPRERAEKAAKTLRGVLLDLSSLDGRQPRNRTHEVKPFAESWMARDSPSTRMANLEALGAVTTLSPPLSTALFAPVPLKLSRAYPQHQLLKNLDADGRASSSTASRIEQLPVVSSLRTTPEMAPLLKWAKGFLSKTVLGGHLPLSAYGIGSGGATSAGAAASEENDGPVGGRDGLLEIRERLEDLLGAYDEDAGEDEEALGTDEEYEQEEEEWDLDD